MKKTNNKYRNNNYNNNNQIYSLNYKFDSISIAGKCSGNALDLIKRYNELAKEALGNSDYVTAEVFRQYAEHYRKIVTEINEKKAQRSQNEKKDWEKVENEQDNSADNSDNTNCGEDNVVSTQASLVETNAVAEVVRPAFCSEKKEFTVIEISPSAAKSELIETNIASTKPKRTIRKKEAI